MKNKFWTVLFWIAAPLTGVVGALCLVYGRVPEGLVIIGSVIAVVIISMLISKKSFEPSQRAVMKAAGNVMVTLEGACKINDGHGENCVMNLCENGVYLDMIGCPVGLIRYSDIELQDSGSVHHIQFDIKDIGVCRFVCNNKIKVKAIMQVLKKNKNNS